MTLNEDFNYALLFVTIIAFFIAIVVTYVLAKCKELARNGNEVKP
jgi:hypothetical protein